VRKLCCITELAADRLPALPQNHTPWSTPPSPSASCRTHPVKVTHAQATNTERPPAAQDALTGQGIGPRRSLAWARQLQGPLQGQVTRQESTYTVRHVCHTCRKDTQVPRPLYTTQTRCRPPSKSPILNVPSNGLYRLRTHGIQHSPNQHATYC